MSCLLLGLCGMDKEIVKLGRAIADRDDWVESLIEEKNKLKAANERLEAMLMERGQEVYRLRAALRCMFEPQPEKPTNWRYSRGQCADIAETALREQTGTKPDQSRKLEDRTG